MDNKGHETVAGVILAGFTVDDLSSTPVYPAV